MNWYPILEAYTEKQPDGLYVNKKAPNDRVINKLTEHSKSWPCCAVGFCMQKIVPSWNKTKDHDALAAALSRLDAANDTSLEKDGLCFHAAIRKGDMADARRLFDQIDKQIKVLDEEDINLVDDVLYDYIDESEDDDSPCSCAQCTAEREEAEEEE